MDEAVYEREVLTKLTLDFKVLHTKSSIALTGAAAVIAALFLNHSQNQGSELFQNEILTA